MAAQKKKLVFASAKIPPADLDALDRIAEDFSEDEGEFISRSTLIRRAVRLVIKNPKLVRA